MKRAVALVTALLSDTLIELLGGAIPVVGDVADVLQLATLFALLGFRYELLISLLEFVPVADVVPFHTIAVILSLRKVKKSSKQSF